VQEIDLNFPYYEFEMDNIHLKVTIALFSTPCACPDSKRKTKRKGAIIRQGRHPWSVQRGFQREGKRKTPHEETRPSRLFLHDECCQYRYSKTCLLPPTPARLHCNCRLLGLHLQSQAEETSRLLLLGLLNILLGSLVSRFCCGLLLSVEGVLAVCSVVR
jgi:hypothetical protein